MTGPPGEQPRTGEDREAEMPRCGLIDECAFYNDKVRGIAKAPGSIKRAYCQRRPEICFRLKLAWDRDVGDMESHATPWGMACGIGRREAAEGKPPKYRAL